MLVGALVAAFYLALWQVASLWIGQSVILPRPAAVLRVLIEQAALPAFWQTVGMSLARVLSGYAAGVLLGALLGGLCHLSGVLRALVRPLMGVVRATPVASFIIITLYFLRVGRVPAFISFLMVAPVVFTGVLGGLGQTDAKLLEMADVFRIPGPRRALRIYLPAALPHAVTAAITSLGLAWKAGIAAEVLGSPALSIGGALREGKVSLDSASMIAWTLVVILLSLALEAALRRLLGRAGRGLDTAGLSGGKGDAA